MVKKRVVWTIVASIVFVLIVLFFVFRGKTEVSEDVLQTPVSTNVPKVVLAPNNSSLIENGKMVFRYDEDWKLLLSEEAEVKWKELIEYVEVAEESDFLYQGEKKKLDVYSAGTVFLPSDITNEELRRLMDMYSQVAYWRYQKDYPETDSEYAMFWGSEEQDISQLDYSQLERYEYKYLVGVLAWSDESFSELIHSNEFAFVIEIVFY